MCYAFRFRSYRTKKNGQSVGWYKKWKKEIERNSTLLYRRAHSATMPTIDWYDYSWIRVWPVCQDVTDSILGEPYSYSARSTDRNLLIGNRRFHCAPTSGYTYMASLCCWWIHWIHCRRTTFVGVTWSCGPTCCHIYPSFIFLSWFKALVFTEARCTSHVRFLVHM